MQTAVQSSCETLDNETSFVLNLYDSGSPEVPFTMEREAVENLSKNIFIKYPYPSFLGEKKTRVACRKLQAFPFPFSIPSFFLSFLEEEEEEEEENISLENIHNNNVVNFLLRKTLLEP
jgi:hypothetical protein